MEVGNVWLMLAQYLKHTHFRGSMRCWKSYWWEWDRKQNLHPRSLFPSSRLVFLDLTFRASAPLSLELEKIGCAGPVEGTHQPGGVSTTALVWDDGLLWVASRDGAPGWGQKNQPLNLDCCCLWLAQCQRPLFPDHPLPPVKVLNVKKQISVVCYLCQCVSVNAVCPVQQNKVFN